MNVNDNTSDVNQVEPELISAIYMREQLADFKKQLDGKLTKSDTIPFQIDDVLVHLKKSEAKLCDSPSDAWFELAKARIALHDSTFISTPDIINGDIKVLRRELYKVWHELNNMQRMEGHVNTTNAADWLIWGERALEEGKVDRPRAMYCIMRARYSLSKAHEFSDWNKFGYIAILIESLYLVAIPIGTLLFAKQSGVTTTELMASPIFQVPFYVFVWGFLGGVSWSVYSAAYWSKRRLFDKHYLSWYLAHPWISAVLGGAVSLIVLGGLASLGTVDINVQPGSSILSLVSFVAGFSTNSIWKLLDRTVRRILDVKGSNRNIHEEAHEENIEEFKSA